MKSSRVPNGSLDFSSSPYKTVKENSAYKNNKKHSTVGNTSINHHQRTTNETKRSISDKQRMLITDAKLPKNSSLSNITNDLSHNSNPSYTNQLPQKARRSLLDWDSFINLSKKPRNLSLKTDNSLRRLPSETIRPASLSPIKTKQESNHNWLSPLRTNASMKKTSVVSVKSNPESDKAHILCDNRSSFEEHAKNHTFKKEEESSSHVSTSACVSPPIVVKNPTESRKRRLSLLSSGCNSLEIPSSDDVDSDSRKQNHEKNHIHIHEAKKRKLSPLVPINKKKKKKRKKSSTLSVNSDQCNDLQSPGTHFDTDNAIQVKEVADQSMSEFSDLQADEISSHGKSEQSLLSVEKSERNENEVVVSKENDESQETFLSTRSPSTPAWLKAIHGPSLRERKSPESVKEDVIPIQNRNGRINPTIFHCLFCAHPFSGKRYRLKHMVSCRLAPKHWTKEKLYKVSQMCESPPILHGISTNSGNTTVDEEISISNGVVCHVNENLQNGHSNVNEKSESTDRSLQFSYLNKEKKKKKKREKPKFIHTSDPELKLVTPPQSSPSLVDSSNCSLDASNTDNKLCDESFKPTESSLSSNNHSPKSIEKSIWQNYRPAYSGPYTCAFCDRVIHKGSNFARHIATCKARLSISTGDTPSAKSSGYEDKRKFHYSFKSFPKVTSKSGNLKRQLPRSQGLNSSVSKMDGNFHSPVFSDDKNIADTPTLKKTDDIETPSLTTNESQHECSGCHQVYQLRSSLLRHKRNHKECNKSRGSNTEDSPLTVSDVFLSLDDSKSISSCDESSYRSHLQTPITSVYDMTTDPDDIFEDLIIPPATTRMKMSESQHDEQDYSAHEHSSISLECSKNVSVPTPKKSLVQHTKTNNNKLSRSPAELSKTRARHSSSPKTARKYSVSIGSENAGELSSAQVSETEGEDEKEYKRRINKSISPPSNDELRTIDDENTTPLAYKCYTCSATYRHRQSVLRHKRKTNHRVDAILSFDKSDDLMSNSPRKDAEECYDRDSGKNVTLDPVSKESTNVVSVQSSTVTTTDNEKHVDSFDVDQQQKPSPSIINDNQILRELTEEKLSSIMNSPSLEKDISNLSNSDYSQSAPSKQSSIQLELQNTSTEQKQESYTSLLTDEMRTGHEQNEHEKNLNASPVAYKCYTCSSIYRHQQSLKRHKRKTRHRISAYSISDGISEVNTTEALEKSCGTSGNKLEVVSVDRIIHEECSQPAFHETIVVENKPDTELSETDSNSNLYRHDKLKIFESSVKTSTINTMNNPLNELFRVLAEEEHLNSMSVEPSVDKEVIFTELHEGGNVSVKEKIPVELSTTVSDISTSDAIPEEIAQTDDVATSIESTSTKTMFIEENKSVEVMNKDDSWLKNIQPSPTSCRYTCLWCSRVVKRYPNFIKHVAACKDRPSGSEIPQRSNTNLLSVSSTGGGNSSHHSRKSYPLGLRSSRPSIQSDKNVQNTEGILNTKQLAKKEKKSTSSCSPHHSRVEEESSKSRRSSISTQHSSDNCIDDEKSIVSNATTIPASDQIVKDNNNNDNNNSTLFICSWCNRSGFKCLRYLNIHSARCSLRPNRLTKQKTLVLSKKYPVQITTNVDTVSGVGVGVVCEQCNREFRSITGLKVHQTMLKHKSNQQSIDKLFSQQLIACPGCSYNSALFDSTEKLLKHLLTLKSNTSNSHTSRSQYWPTVLSVPNLGYGCHICGMLLASESRLDKHKKAVHETWLLEEQHNLSPSKLTLSTLSII